MGRVVATTSAVSVMGKARSAAKLERLSQIAPPYPSAPHQTSLWHFTDEIGSLAAMPSEDVFRTFSVRFRPAAAKPLRRLVELRGIEPLTSAVRCEARPPAYRAGLLQWCFGGRNQSAPRQK
jgi:hypothetical protein